MYDRIRALREDNDLSQKTVAGVLCMSQTGYSKYETGENDIPTSVLIKLSMFYDTNIDYLLGVTNYRNSFPINSESKNLYKFYRSRLKDLKNNRVGRNSSD